MFCQVPHYIHIAAAAAAYIHSIFFFIHFMGNFRWRFIVCVQIKAWQHNVMFVCSKATIFIVFFISSNKTNYLLSVNVLNFHRNKMSGFYYFSLEKKIVLLLYLKSNFE